MGPAPFSGHACCKGSILYGLDRISVADNARELMERLQTAIADKASNDFRELHQTFDLYLFSPLNLAQARSAASMTYLQRWFDDTSPDALFEQFQPIAPIFALGVLKVLEESLLVKPRPLPIDAWWIVDHTTFEIATLVSKQQVTMLLATPRPGRIPMGIWSPEVEAWTTSRFGVVNRKFPRSR